MHLRTIADTIAMLAHYAPNRIPNEGHLLRELLVNSRMLQEIWFQHCTQIAQQPPRDVIQLLEEVAVASPLIQMMAELLEQNAGPTVRQQARRIRTASERCARHLLDQMQSRVLTVTEQLRLQRLQRRIAAWITELRFGPQRPVAWSRPNSQGLRAAMLLAPLTSLALRQTVHDRVCQQTSRSRLLNRMCELALQMLPTDFFGNDGQPKSLWRRHLEFADCHAATHLRTVPAIRR